MSNYSSTNQIAVYDQNFVFKGYLDTGFNLVVGLDFDSLGRLVAAGRSPSRIKMYDPSGSVLADFSNPSVGSPIDLKIGPGTLAYVGTQATGVTEFTTAGSLTRTLGSASYDGVAILPGNRMWAGGDAQPGQIHVFDLVLGTQVGTVFLDNGQGNAESMHYSASTNTVLTTDTSTNTVRVFERDLNGAFVRQFTAPVSGYSYGVTRGPGGEVFAGVYATGTVVRWTPSGSFVGTIAVPQVPSTVGIAWAGSVNPCGNSTIDPGEQCDDGNTLNGDCCSSTCQYEPNGSACAGDGLGCTDDVCNGSGTCTHPLTAASTICRADAGECDVAEVCDGVSSACPADAFEPSGTACTADAETCTLDECDGAGLCAHLAGNAGTECRASAGECDPAEACDGVATDCPVDAKSTDVCRGAAGVCDIAESCDGVADSCPADVLEPGTTVCRVDAGDCDVQETCTGGDAGCPVDAKEADGTGCDDGSLCTQTDQCSAGVCVGADPLDCDDGNACTQDSCTAMGGCVNDDAPRSSCLTAQKSLLLLKQKGAGVKDKLVWKWLKGQAFGQPDLGAPTTATAYALCIYSGTTETLIADAALDAGSTWSAVGSKGYKYFDAAGSPDGIVKALAKGGAAGKSKALAKGKGSNLPDPVLADITAPVKTQLVNLESGFCLESVFQTGDVLKSTATQFKAKAQ
ncbi:MAG: hypothetical protein SF182_20965 [Deltaproteobacteria bacterium]|nr:hypothetical protein [Deltaproteobacteria bacterium]